MSDKYKLNIDKVKTLKEFESLPRLEKSILTIFFIGDTNPENNREAINEDDLTFLVNEINSQTFHLNDKEFNNYCKNLLLGVGYIVSQGILVRPKK